MQQAGELWPVFDECEISRRNATRQQTSGEDASSGSKLNHWPGKRTDVTRHKMRKCASRWGYCCHLKRFCRPRL